MNTNLDVKDESGRSELEQSRIDQFCERQIEMLELPLWSLTEIGPASIHRPMLYHCDPPSDPERRIGFLRRLLSS